MWVNLCTYAPVLTPSPWWCVSRAGTRLEGVPPSAWVCFERVLVLKDTFTGGGRVAFGQEDMQLYRRRVYELHGLDPPVAAGAAFAPGSGSDPALPPALPPPPRTITFLRKSADRRVINEAAMLRMLREFGDVRVLEFGAATPMVSQLQTMASTGVLVSVHTSALANAVFLRPGSAVVELIHYNWIWYTLDMSFKVQTEVVGDVHHFAWRARRPEHVAYINPRDQARFGGPEWAAENVRVRMQGGRGPFVPAMCHVQLWKRQNNSHSRSVPNIRSE